MKPHFTTDTWTRNRAKSHTVRVLEDVKFFYTYKQYKQSKKGEVLGK